MKREPTFCATIARLAIVIALPFSIMLLFGCDVQLDEEATRLLHEFDNRCDAHIREGGTDGVRQLWNRAHLKAVRIAGLLAAADRPHTAVVNAEEAQWAIDTVVRDAQNLASRFDEVEPHGDVGPHKTDGVDRGSPDLAPSVR